MKELFGDDLKTGEKQVDAAATCATDEDRVPGETRKYNNSNPSGGTCFHHFKSLTCSKIQEENESVPIRV